jgi:metal-sulfur cluster biosynthetic enzyme
MMEALYAVPGVKKVIMEQTWYPLWSVNLLTDLGRKKLNL